MLNKLQSSGYLCCAESEEIERNRINFATEAKLKVPRAKFRLPDNNLGTMFDHQEVWGVNDSRYKYVYMTSPYLSQPGSIAQAQAHTHGMFSSTHPLYNPKATTYVKFFRSAADLKSWLKTINK